MCCPALGVMLLVIGYPVYYTIYLSFFNTPPNLAMEDKIFVGLDNYRRILHERQLPRGHLEHAGLDGLLDPLRLRASASARRSRSIREFIGPRHAARHRCSFPT